MIMGGILCYGEAKGAARQQPDKQRQVALARDKLLYAHGSHEKRRYIGADIRITLVGAYHNSAGFCNTEIHTGHSGINLRVFFPHIGPHHTVEVMRVII